MQKPIADAPLCRNEAPPPEAALTAVRQGYKEAGSRDPADRAQVAELVDALASGASGLTAVKVRVLSWAPDIWPGRLFRALSVRGWRGQFPPAPPAPMLQSPAIRGGAKPLA